MTPAARIATAMDLLDQILAGDAAEKVLTNWARKSRYAGSGDRAAIRDHVFDALRCRRSFGWLGGSDTGRGLMIGALRAAGTDPVDLLTGGSYGAPPLTAEEAVVRELRDAPEPVQLDAPDWLMEDLRASLGDDLGRVMTALRQRAPVFLRVNLRLGDRAAAIAALAAEDIGAEPHSLSGTALRVTRNPRRIQTSQAFQTGLVELQDASSQAVVDRLHLSPGERVLDYCAGGGGKSLAIAARADVAVFAHDIDPRRMQDIPARSARATAQISQLTTSDLTKAAPFDMVFCDAPCSGSGAWRRTPDAKWRLTRERLNELIALQAEVLTSSAVLVRPGGRLAYATCSILRSENGDQIERFLSRHPGWQLAESRAFSPLDGGDGFFVAQLEYGNDD